MEPASRRRPRSPARQGSPPAVGSIGEPAFQISIREAAWPLSGRLSRILGVEPHSWILRFLLQRRVEVLCVGDAGIPTPTPQEARRDQNHKEHQRRTQIARHHGRSSRLRSHTNSQRPLALPGRRGWWRTDLQMQHAFNISPYSAPWPCMEEAAGVALHPAMVRARFLRLVSAIQVELESSDRQLIAQTIRLVSVTDAEDHCRTRPAASAVLVPILPRSLA